MKNKNNFLNCFKLNHVLFYLYFTAGLYYYIMAIDKNDSKKLSTATNSI